MSIAKLRKITVMGMLAEKHAIMSSLQEAGCLHLLPLNENVKSVQQKATDKSDDAHTALRFLTNTAFTRKQITRKDKFEVEGFVDKVIQLKHALRIANDKRDFLLNRIKLFEPWGDIFFPPHESLKGHKLWFYVVPHNKLNMLKTVDMPWQMVSKDNRFAYIVLISKEEPNSKVMPVERSHLGSEPLSELRFMLEDTEVEIEALYSERQALTRYLYLLALHLNEADNKAALKFANKLTLDTHHTLVVQGWVEQEQLPAIEQLLQRLGCAFVVEAPLASEQPPTLIQQPKPLEASKDLALFYQVPDYRSWDPSKLLFLSFSLFFAMILADAGYAVVLLIGLFAWRKKILKKEKGTAYFNLGLSLCGFTLLYGIIIGSYFGLSPPADSLPGQLKILDLQNFDAMMTLSIIIGVIHIGFANVLVLLSSPSWSFRLSRIGWLGLISSALFYWLYMNNTTVTLFATVAAGISALLIFLFSSEQTTYTPKAWLLRLKDGFLSLAGVMTAFGDVLSYMRLFALGLASASLALTFNQLAHDVYQSSPGIGLLGAILIIAVGHVLNLMLSLISGVVHGLRLNYIEFYKWGLPKEGKVFQRFSKKEIKP